VAAAGAVVSAVPAGCGGDVPSTRTPVVVGGTVTIATASGTPSFNLYSQFGLSLAPCAYGSLVDVARDGRVVSAPGRGCRLSNRHGPTFGHQRPFTKPVPSGS
jgi:hypothetical protein